MGIPLYFKTISSKFPETIIEELEEVINQPVNNHLFFDLNCAIHPCCRNILKEYNNNKTKDNVLEKRMLNEIIDYMKKIINLTKPNYIYIAIDGVAPFSKMAQQRERRYKSQLNKQIDDNMRREMGIDLPNHWDTNAISPGTAFMESVYEKIIYSIQNGELEYETGVTKKIIFSSANDPGEGEHKILNYMKNTDTIKENDNLIVYGLDADLIMLSMSSKLNKIYLLREALQFNKVIEGKFLLLDIDYLKYGLIMTLRDHIAEFDSLYVIEDIDRIIDDYIFLCYFLGNDFLPHIPGLSLKDNGHDILLKNYIAILVNFREYLVDRNKMKISNQFIFSLVNKLAGQEEQLYQKFVHKRSRLRPGSMKTNDPYENRKNLLNDLPISDKRNLKIEKYINLGKDKYKSRYYKMCFDFEHVDEVEKACENYMTGIVWVFNYYFKGCASWEWKYDYRHAPLLSDIANYIGKNNINSIKFKASKPLEPLNQLLYILPKQSKNLLPIHFQHLFDTLYFYPDYYSMDMLFKRFFWQAQPILPDVDYKQIKKIYSDPSSKYKKRCKNNKEAIPLYQHFI